MNEDMKQYGDLINESLFDEAFMLLEKNANQIDDPIEKSRHIRGFFGHVFDSKFFSNILKSDKLLSFSSSTVTNLRTRPFLNDVGQKLGNYIDATKVSIMLAYLVLNNEFDNARFILPFSNRNLQDFRLTIKEIGKRNDVDALRFICENMENIHFNEDALLRVSSDMSPDALKMLIEEFDFDINQQSRENGFNLIHALVSDKNLKNFQYVVENYGDTINWSLTATRDRNNMTVFDIIDQQDMQNEFYSIILEDMTLRSQYLERIATSLFNKKEVINKCSQTDIYRHLFAHPNFDSQVINLGQGYFLYGMLSRIGVIANSEHGDQELARSYMRIIDQYVNTTMEDTIPDGNDYHIVGAALYVATVTPEKVVADAVSLIIRRYKQYVNKPNPNGTMPINQVAPENHLYRVLMSNGALPPEPEVGFWGKLRGKGNNVSRQAQMEVMQATQTLDTPRQGQMTGNMGQIRQQMREDFRDMRQYLTHQLCDPSIKFQCENMFLKADKLATMMEKYQINQGFEEMNFLSENFSNYLKGTIKYYIDVCQAVVDLASGDKRDAKLKEAKEKCQEQVHLLTEQLALISDNIFADVENNANRDLRVRGRFLEEKFGTTGGNKKIRVHDDAETNSASIKAQEPEVKEPNIDDLVIDFDRNKAENDSQNQTVNVMGSSRKPKM
jgi:hypothetical protein